MTFISNRKMTENLQKVTIKAKNPKQKTPKWSIEDILLKKAKIQSKKVIGIEAIMRIKAKKWRKKVEVDPTVGLWVKNKKLQNP